MLVGEIGMSERMRSCRRRGKPEAATGMAVRAFDTVALPPRPRLSSRPFLLWFRVALYYSISKHACLQSFRNAAAFFYRAGLPNNLCIVRLRGRHLLSDWKEAHARGL